MTQKNTEGNLQDFLTSMKSTFEPLGITVEGAQEIPPTDSLHPKTRVGVIMRPSEVRPQERRQVSPAKRDEQPDVETTSNGNNV